MINLFQIGQFEYFRIIYKNYIISKVHGWVSFMQSFTLSNFLLQKK